MALFTKRGDQRTRLSSDGFFSNHLDRFLKPNCGAAVKTLSMEGGTTLVFLPMPNFNNPNYAKELDVLPDRTDTPVPNYSNWLFDAEGVLYFGKNPVSFLFDEPDDSSFNLKEHYPVHQIVNAVYNLKKSGQQVDTPFGSSTSDNWLGLVEKTKDDAPVGGKKQFSKITIPQTLALAYCVICSSGKDAHMSQGAPYGSSPEDPAAIILISNNAVTSGTGLVTAMDAPISDGRSEYKHPIITGQKYIHFYDRKVGSCPAMNAAAGAAATAFGGHRRPSQSNQGGQQMLAGYGVYISDTMSGRSTDPTLIREQAIALACRKLKPWTEVLRGYLPQEAAQLIADNCGFPISLLYHAWKSCPHYYSEEMRHRMRNPVSANFGQTPAPAQAPAQSMFGGAPPAQAPTQSMFGGAPPAQDDGGSMFGTATDNPPLDEAPWGGRISDPVHNGDTFPMSNPPPDITHASHAAPAAAPAAGPSGAIIDPAAVEAARLKFSEAMKRQGGQPPANKPAN